LERKNLAEGKLLNFSGYTSKLLFEICSNPNLKALCFECIYDLPYRFIIGSRPAQKLMRLALAQITISDYDLQVPMPMGLPLQQR
jgi:hypothetical protein